MKKKITGAAVALLLAAGMIGGMAAPAQAGTWLPQRPSSWQPVGWGDTCAVVKTKTWWGGSYWTEYRWLTTSLRTSSCLAYRHW